MNAKEYWEEKYGEQKTKEDKLQIALMQEYGDYISRTVEKLAMQKTVDLDEKIYSSRDVIKIINAEGNRFIYGAKEDHTEHLTRTIFCYLADLFQHGKQ